MEVLAKVAICPRLTKYFIRRFFNVTLMHTDLQEMLEKKPPSTSEGKCFRACIMRKYDMMDADGKLDKSVAEKHAEMYTGGDADEMKIAHEIIETCGALEVSTDHCQAAVEYGKCIKDQAEAHGVSDTFEM